MVGSWKFVLYLSLSWDNSAWCSFASYCMSLISMDRAENNKERRGGRKSLILKTWDRCRSIGNGRRSPTSVDNIARSPRVKSLPRQRVAPEGCFSVYVGREKEKYVIRTECLNHPLFKMLLDEAEMEYGYAIDGPLELPCDIDHFEKVMWEMEHDEDYDSVTGRRLSCNFGPAYSAYQLLSPARPAIAYRFQ